MNTRERWIVGLMIVVVLYGGFSTANSLWRKQQGRYRGDNDKSTETARFVETARARLALMVLTPTETVVLDKAADAWPNSPFWEHSEQTTVVVEQPEELQFTGYLKVGDVQIAILNGREYRLGETVSSSDFVVESIAANQVVLASQGGGRRLSITLNATGNTGKKP